MQGAGRGVFARVAIQKGEIIERCPVIEIPTHEASRIEESIMVTYLYFLGKHKERPMLALGFGSLYNHSYKPNAMYREKYKEHTIDFVALRSIEKNEEITVNYAPENTENTSPLWFAVSK